MVQPGVQLSGRLLAVLALVACYTPPELPIIDDVPLVPSNSCRPDTTVFVTEVLDGDTFRDALSLDDDPSYRLLGVDAPEIAHDPEPADCYGAEAYQELTELILGRRITLSFDNECVGKFGRTLVYAWLVDEEYADISSNPGISDYERTVPGYDTPGLLVNEWLVGQGYAQVFPEELFGEILYQDELERAESEAMAFGLGLWSVCSGDGTPTSSRTAVKVSLPMSTGKSSSTMSVKERR